MFCSVPFCWLIGDWRLEIGKWSVIFEDGGEAADTGAFAGAAGIGLGQVGDVLPARAVGGGDELSRDAEVAPTFGGRGLTVGSVRPAVREPRGLAKERVVRPQNRRTVIRWDGVAGRGSAGVSRRIRRW